MKKEIRKRVILMFIETIKDSVLREDLEYILDKSGLPLDKMKDSSVLVTGATGLVGSQLTRFLVYANEKLGLGMNVIAMVRSREKAESILGSEICGLEYFVSEITEPVSYSGKVDFIIHTASITASKMMISAPVETIDTAVTGTKNLLELAKEKNVKSFVYISSMEVYGSFAEEKYVSEDDMGYINPMTIRSNYPLSKRICENMCAAYSAEYNVPAKIARLSQTFGAGILPGENRVFAQFARSAMSGSDIVLHTKGLSEGNYCYTRDTVAAILLIMLEGKNSEAYNVSNENTHITIADMAKMVAEKIADGKIKVIFDIPEDNKFGYAADTKMKLNTEKLCSLGWTPSVNLEEAYRRLIDSMQQCGI